MIRKCYYIQPSKSAIANFNKNDQVPFKTHLDATRLLVISACPTGAMVLVSFSGVLNLVLLAMVLKQVFYFLFLTKNKDLYKK